MIKELLFFGALMTSPQLAKTSHNYINNDVIIYGNVLRTETQNKSTTIYVNDTYSMSTPENDENLFIINNVQKYICTMQIYAIGSQGMSEHDGQCSLTINEQENIYTLNNLNWYDYSTNLEDPNFYNICIVNGNAISTRNYYISLTGLNGYNEETEISYSITITEKSYLKGFVDGETKGYKEGYDMGLQDGENTGYSKGYEIGFKDGTSNAGSPMLKPFDLIKQSFLSINQFMNKQIFPGITIWTIISIPLIFSLLILILKVIRG